MSHDMPGTYVAVEGIDGAGKGTAVQGIAEAFPRAFLTVEPTDLPPGRLARDWTLQEETAPTTDALVNAADHAEHAAQILEPELEEGGLVVSDRSPESTYAYQWRELEGAVAGDPFEWLDDLYSFWRVEPDLVVWIDVPAEVGFERCDGKDKNERLERLETAREGYLWRADEESGMYHRIDGTLPPEDVIRRAQAAVEGVL